ncbi:MULTISPECIES: hypothetical protein [Streptomyces]|uniref:Uncharacterized protein n=1 Tax=Streptomyces dengpaensis TaxID=2049881 RepID=A0ABN5I5R2_9ACTN|nr:MULTISPECIES: hypothetical protein [Streptomyces]AVH58403.1 hypothetical protein C4B68_24485 [Streptomyces dengpaensis]PIB06078.1 hypothetical protein B1C81_26205 [Streptomyces sp. HG99]
MTELYAYADAQNHKVAIEPASSGRHIAVHADDLAIGGAHVDVWVPFDEVRQLADALTDGAAYEHTDHMGDRLAVEPFANWTTFELTRCREDDDEEPTTVRVAVLSARLPKLRAALTAATEEQPPADEEQAQQPRRILTEDEYEAAYAAARRAFGRYTFGTVSPAVDEAVTAALATVGILTPAPEAEPDTCPAMFADPNGMWWQCAEDVDHDPADGHDAGDWSWPHAAEQVKAAEHPATVRAQAFEEAATIAEQVATEMRACDGTWPEEWSSRDVRDAVESAAGRIRAAAEAQQRPRSTSSAGPPPRCPHRPPPQSPSPSPSSPPAHPSACGPRASPTASPAAPERPHP